VNIHTFCCRNINAFYYGVLPPEPAGVLRNTRYMHRIPYLMPEKILNFEKIWPPGFSGKEMSTCTLRRFLPPTWTIIAGSTLQWVFIRLSKGYYPSDHFSVSPHRLLNVPEKRRKTPRRPSVRRSVGPTLFGQAEKKRTDIINCLYVMPYSLEDRYKRFGETSYLFHQGKEE
jgi:hypothetical protein